jgi:hypothetical protein
MGLDGLNTGELGLYGDFGLKRETPAWFIAGDVGLKFGELGEYTGEVGPYTLLGEVGDVGEKDGDVGE